MVLHFPSQNPCPSTISSESPWNSSGPAHPSESWLSKVQLFFFLFFLLCICLLDAVQKLSTSFFYFRLPHSFPNLLFSPCDGFLPFSSPFSSFQELLRFTTCLPWDIFLLIVLQFQKYILNKKVELIGSHKKRRGSGGPTLSKNLEVVNSC